MAGGHLFLILFIYAMDLLVQRLMWDMVISGVLVLDGRGQEVKPALCMHISVIVRDRVSMEQVVGHTQSYREACGAKLNVN